MTAGKASGMEPQDCELQPGCRELRGAACSATCEHRAGKDAVAGVVKDKRKRADRIERMWRRQ
jgi:hypothetical protein